MPYDVLMPQLGMAQDSAVIVSWLKAPGDAVAADDPLMEVETDKATMEVPAGRDGFLAEIRAATGAEVPVGDVIAIISKSLDDVVATPTPTPAPVQAAADPAQFEVASGGRVVSRPAQAPSAGISPSVQQKPPPPALNVADPKVAARVFASPKARLAAAERGLDLNTIVLQGATQPIHFNVLERFSVPAGGGLSVLSARANGAAFVGLLAKQTDLSGTRRKVLSAFGCGALRMAVGWSDRHVTVEIGNLTDTSDFFENPDTTVPSSPQFTENVNGTGVDLTLFDLIDTRLTEYRPASGNPVQVSVATGGDGEVLLCLSFSQATLSAAVAAAFLDNFAARIEDPVRHIL